MTHEHSAVDPPVNGLWQIRKLLRSSLRALSRPFASGRCARPLDALPLALVIPLDGDVADEVTRLQVGILRKYGRNPGLEAPPHITLKLGFNVTDSAPFEEYLAQLGGEIYPFEIVINGFDFFDEGILFLDVEPSPELEKLRQRILCELAERWGIQAQPIEDSRFRFHVTLAYGLSNREFAELRKSFASRALQFKFSARHIDMFCHTGQHWVTLKRTNLRGCANPSTSTTAHEIHAG
ncbi:MAG: 2'-5' RNA ligase family protein [Luteolibacter sp.]